MLDEWWKKRVKSDLFSAVAEKPISGIGELKSWGPRQRSRIRGIICRMKKDKTITKAGFIGGRGPERKVGGCIIIIPEFLSKRQNEGVERRGEFAN